MKVLTVHYQEVDDWGNENEYPLSYLEEAIEQGGGFVVKIEEVEDE